MKNEINKKLRAMYIMEKTNDRTYAEGWFNTRL